MTEAVGTTRTWVEQFRAEHSIEKLPMESRILFQEQLRHRAAIISYYEAFPADRWDERIGVGNSAKEDLVDLIATSKMRSKAIQTGKMDSWTDPDKDKLKELSGAELVEQIKLVTEGDYEALLETDLQREVSLPYGKKTTGYLLVLGALTHESMHLGFANKFGDQFGNLQTQTPIPRPTTFKDIYG